MIDFRIAQFRLRYDGIQWTVTETMVAQKGKKIGEERDTNYGYHGKLSHALLDVFDRLNGQGDAQSVQALLAAVGTHERAIVASVAEVDRQLQHMRHGEG